MWARLCYGRLPLGSAGAHQVNRAEMAHTKTGKINRFMQGRYCRALIPWKAVAHLKEFYPPFPISASPEEVTLQQTIAPPSPTSLSFISSRVR